MSRGTPCKEDVELIQLREADQQLLLRQRQCAEIPGRIAHERKEQESMMPPLADIADRERMLAHEQLVSRGQVANIQRDQSRSFLLLLLLLAATGTLIWWGVKLMQG